MARVVTLTLLFAIAKLSPPRDLSNDGNSITSDPLRAAVEDLRQQLP